MDGLAKGTLVSEDKVLYESLKKYIDLCRYDLPEEPEFGKTACESDY